MSFFSLFSLSSSLSLFPLPLKKKKKKTLTCPFLFPSSSSHGSPGKGLAGLDMIEPTNSAFGGSGLGASTAKSELNRISVAECKKALSTSTPCLAPRAMYRGLTRSSWIAWAPR